MSRSKRPNRDRARPSRPKPIGSADSPTAVSRLPAWKKALFGLVACGLILGLAEIALALVGVRPVSFQRDPYVGFSRQIPHFIPDSTASEPGMLVTADAKRSVMNVQRFTARKPAGTFRIFCLGGSTTYGHPYTDPTSFAGWLRATLPEADPTRRWEVINCGGISYASYREALLMEELIRYEPDLFIVLSAHNEFLEQRTYSGLLAIPEPVRGVSAALSRTRVFTALQTGLDRLRSKPVTSSSPTTILADNPEAILDRTIGPQSYHRDDELQRHVIDHYRFNLARMAQMAQSVKARLLFVNPASNLRSCSPFKSEHRPAMTTTDLANWEQHIQAALDARRQQHFGESLASVNRAAAIDDRYADLHYLRGHLLWDLDRFKESDAAFQRARDEDVCPLRAGTALINATAEIAQRSQVPVIDFVHLLEDRALNHIPGDDWFLDHVHPTIEGHRQLALLILTNLMQTGVVHAAATWNEETQRRIKDEVSGHLTPKDQAQSLVTLAKVMSWAGKGDEAYRAAARAGQLAPEDSLVVFEMGKSAAHAGRRDDAIRHLEKAVSLTPRFVEALSLLGTQLLEAGQPAAALQRCREAVALRPDDPLLLINLGEVLRRQGNGADAEVAIQQAIKLSPDYAEAHSNLGWLLKDRGDFAGATREFREALRLRPGGISPGLGLTWVLAAQPRATDRKPAEAVALAERLVELSDHHNWMCLDALAAAYASAGRFPDAVKIANNALELAIAMSPTSAPAVRKRLDLYRAGQPYVDETGATRSP